MPDSRPEQRASNSTTPMIFQDGDALQFKFARVVADDLDIPDHFGLRGNGGDHIATIAITPNLLDRIIGQLE